MIYQIVDRIPCWVEFKYEIEAHSEEEAKQLYQDQSMELVECGFSIEENIEGMENYLIIEVSKDKN